jgi:hypothetical protein
MVFLVPALRRGLLALLGLAVVVSVAVMGYRRWQAIGLLTRLDASRAQAQQTRTADITTQRRADSAAAFAAGRRAELARSLTSLQRLDDSLTRLRPAPVQLPALPPRE